MDVIFVIGGKFVAVSCDQLDLLFCFIDENDSEQKYGYQRLHIFD
jgi:hypothetical protein